jgi:putative aldouronate transport system permease protein
VNVNRIGTTRGDRVLLVVIYSVVTLVAVACFYPFWDLFVLALKDPVEAYKGGFNVVPTTFDLSAYRQVLASREVWRAAYNSLWRVAVGTTLTVVLTTLVSYPLSKRDEFPGYRFWMTYVIITMYFSGGLIPTYLTYRSLGLVDNRLVLVLPQAILAYNVIMTRNFLRSIPRSLEESAKIDGASDFVVWLRIVVPLSLPIMATVGLWTAVMHWNAFFDVLVYINDRSKYVLQIVLRRMLINNEVNMFTPPEISQRLKDGTQGVSPPGEQLKAAFIMVCTIPIILVYPFAQKYFIKGIIVGAVKG